MKKLGLDYETLRKENPAIIYCSISGFGQEGPLSKRPAHDINYAALSGNLQMMNDRGPGHVSIPNFHVADIAGGGYMTTIAVLAAVQYRHTGYPVGYHTEEILRQFGLNEEEISFISSK